MTIAAETPIAPDLAREIRNARDRLLAAIGRSLKLSRTLDAPGPNGGGEDEANYALAWLPFLLVTDDAAVRDHAEALLADLLRWVAEDCVDGYRPEQEAHHGTEPFLLFLPRWAAISGDERAIAPVVRAAAFARNAVPGQPRWYDTKRQVFVSYQLGSRSADRDPQWRVENANHLRFLHIALAAHRLAGDQAALDWALGYAMAKARRLVDAPEPLPVAWDLDGRPLATHADTEHGLAGDPLNGVECHLASGAVHALADAWAHAREPLLRDAARRIVEPLLDRLDDPCADVAAAALRRYRLGFGDDRYDARLRAAIADWDTTTPEEHLVLPARLDRRQHGSGPGRRRDMVRWYVTADDGALRPSSAVSPAAATLAWELSGDARWARYALDLAARRTQVATRGLRSGREHADMGSSLAAVMAGHGRCWGTGAVTGCLQPLLLGGDVEHGVLAPALAYRDDALVRHDLDGARHVTMG